MRRILIAAILLLSLEGHALAESFDDCARIHRSAAESLTAALNLAGHNNPKRFVDVLRQEHSRRALTRSQIKKCAPQIDRLIAGIEQCAASGDRELSVGQML
jgi:hypothetical protein